MGRWHITGPSRANAALDATTRCNLPHRRRATWQEFDVRIKLSSKPFSFAPCADRSMSAGPEGPQQSAVSQLECCGDQGWARLGAGLQRLDWGSAQSLRIRGGRHLWTGAARAIYDPTHSTPARASAGAVPAFTGASHVGRESPCCRPRSDSLSAFNGDSRPAETRAAWLGRFYFLLLK